MSEHIFFVFEVISWHSEQTEMPGKLPGVLISLSLILNITISSPVLCLLDLLWILLLDLSSCVLGFS